MKKLNFKFEKKYILLIIIFIILFFNSFVKADTITNYNVRLNWRNTKTSQNFTWSDVWNVNKPDVNNSNVYAKFGNRFQTIEDTIYNYMLSSTNSTDIDSFKENYYYSIVYAFNPYYNSSMTSRIVTNFYFYSKSNGPFHYNFSIGYASNITSSSNVINTKIYPSKPYNLFYSGAVSCDSDNSGCTTIIGTRQNTTIAFYLNTSTSTNYNNLPLSYSNNLFTLGIGFVKGTLNSYGYTNLSSYYVDSNTDKSLYFDKNVFNSENPYYFTSFTDILTSTSYSLGQKIYNDPDWSDSNYITDFGDNTFGASGSTVLLSNRTEQSPILNNSVNCPINRQFNNSICYLQDSDIIDFNNLNNSISIKFTFDNSTTSDFPYIYGKYYILTYRIYSNILYLPYRLNVFSGTTSRQTQIIDTKFYDYGLYKDYQIIFTNQSGESSDMNLSLNGFALIFKNLYTYTDSLSKPINFGVSSSLKYQMYNNEPSSIDISNNYNTNTIDSISSNNQSSFFTNFKVNDRGLSQIVLLPLGFVRSMLSSTCNPVNLPIPHSNSNAQLPCLSSVFSTYAGGFWSLYQVIINGIIYYRICLSIFNIMKNFYNVSHNEIEVIDL